VRDATRIGSDCTQAIGRKAILGGGGGFVVGSEDCLYLNIYTPAAKAAEARPVMVYIPGGAFTVGSGANYDPVQAGGRSGRVVVTLNYRLGALGWLAHPQFQAEGEGFGGNFGLMDQQAALQWVHRNIAAFGGDPSDVTLFRRKRGRLVGLLSDGLPGVEGPVSKGHPAERRLPGALVPCQRRAGG
jgi:para-nitrobenzyl esterase